jgi:hypothetical protein
MGGAVRIRLFRGQCVVREIVDGQSSTLWTPDVRTKDRDVKTHRGVVLGLGPPAFLDAGAASSPVVPWDCSVGDVVQYHYVHNHEAHTRPWTDGELATWVPQMCVDGVIE